MKKAHSMLPFYIILIPVVIFMFTLNSGVFQPHVKALTVGKHSLTAAEFNYYYYSVYIDFTNENYDKLAEIGYKTTSRPRNQRYAEGVTWEDHFKELACERLVRVLVLNDLATEAGYAFTQSDYLPVADRLAEIEAFCAEFGVETKDYFKSYYGGGMNRECFETQLRLETQADAYAAYLAGTMEAADTQALLEDNESAVTIRTIYFAVAKDRFAKETTKTQWDDLAVKTTRLLYRWGEYGGEEAAFARLADSYSEEGNPVEGGLHEGLLRTELSEELAGWCFDAGRKAGESTYIRTGSGDWIILYIDGGEAVLAETAERYGRREAVNDLIRERAANYTVTEGWLGMQLAM